MTYCRSLSARGYRVLQIDRESSYGSGWMSLNLASLENWVNTPADEVSSIDSTNICDTPKLKSNDCRTHPLFGSPKSNGEQEVRTGIECDKNVTELTLEEFYNEITDECDVLMESLPYTPLFIDRRLWYSPFSQQEGKDEEIQLKLHQESNRFNFDLSPKMLYAESPIISTLVTSGVARYLDFRGSFEKYSEHELCELEYFPFCYSVYF